jgi:hypothetical protein
VHFRQHGKSLFSGKDRLFTQNIWAESLWTYALSQDVPVVVFLDLPSFPDANPMRFILLSALVAVAVSNSTALADYMVGSVAFNSSRTPGTGSLNQEISFSNVVSDAAGLSGDFVGLNAGTPWGTFTLPAAPGIGQSVNISGGDFGTFVGIVTGDTSEEERFGQFNRFVALRGTWTPTGIGFFAGKTNPHVADLTFSFGRTNSAVAALNAAITFQSHGAIPVPEPSTFMFAGAALAGVVWLRRRRPIAEADSATVGA